MKNAKGLYMGWPTWCDKVDKQCGVGPIIFDKWNIVDYGRFFGKPLYELSQYHLDNRGESEWGQCQ